MRAYQLPIVTDLATKVGPRLWRKTVLRCGRISKGGVTLDVDRAKLAAYAANFQAGALDSVPFVLVDAANRHTDDPERHRGALRGLQVSDDGQRLDALIETSAEGTALIEANPDLGVSVRITERLERADGRSHGPTVLHVAGTLDPEISRLGPWRPADLSADGVEVVDLTGTPDDDPAPAAGETPAQQGGPNHTAKEPALSDALTADELARLRALLDRATAPDSDKPDGDDTPELTDDELDALAKAALDEPEKPAAPAQPEQPAEPEKVLVNASAGDAERDLAAELDLANARAESQAIELARLRTENDRRAYETERDTLARDFGIPPRIVDLARPLLEGAGHTIDLAAGKQVDAGAVVRNLLRELGRTFKALDLSAATGSPVGADADSAAQAQAELDEFVKRARTELRNN